MPTVGLKPEIISFEHKLQNKVKIPMTLTPTRMIKEKI